MYRFHGNHNVFIYFGFTFFIQTVYRKVELYGLAGNRSRLVISMRSSLYYYFR